MFYLSQSHQLSHQFTRGIVSGHPNQKSKYKLSFIDCSKGGVEVIK